MNDTRKEYTICALDELPAILLHAERAWGWDLGRDHIYIWHSDIQPQLSKLVGT